MRALLLDRPGSPLDLRLADVPIPEPAVGRIRVRVEACGLNPVDWKVAAGGPADMRWPHVPGCDFVGVVDAMPSGTSAGAHPGALRVGQRVVGHGDLRVDGALAEYVIADPLTVAVVPDGVDPLEAVALPCAAGTAYQSIVERLRVAAEDVVFVTGGGGAVGGFAVQLAAAAGARVIATASADDHERVRRLGATDLLDHHTEDVPARVRALTGGRGVDRIVDVLPAPSATRSLDLLVHGGGIACVGGVADIAAAHESAPSVHAIALGAAHASGDVRARRRLGTITETLVGRLAAGTLDPLLVRTVPLEDGAAALESVRSGRVRGKVVVRV